MNRIDRLTAILLLLQGGKRSAGEIARRFEVSRRTIQRDIEALCEMGFPIMAELGISGGYSLPGDYSLPALALTLHEVLLLRLALSSLFQLSETPFKQERDSLLTKVQALLSPHEGEDLDQLQQTVSLGVPSRPYPTPFLDQILQCAHERQWLAVTYRSEKGTSQQKLLPMRVRTEAGLWYCEAYSYERQEVRVYRVDRFLATAAMQTSPQVEQPASSIVYVHPSHPEVRIQLTARGVLRLERETPLASRLQLQENGEGLLSLHLRPEEYSWLVSILLGLGGEAKILAPEELRVLVVQTAQEIARHFADL
ncbi:MAG TPA: WYL domain-containing protein [Ktedonobacteraceae bacterium]|nr:WYL domain-containing protein [Ktedonobacteraceae bacterium]